MVGSGVAREMLVVAEACWAAVPPRPRKTTLSAPAAFITSCLFLCLLLDLSSFAYAEFCRILSLGCLFVSPSLSK